MNAKLKNWQGPGQQILIGLVLATLAVAVIEANSDYDEECGWSLMGTTVSHYGQGDRHKIRIGRGRCRLEVDLEGDVDVAPDHRAITRLGPGASLSIMERKRRERRRLDVRRGDGGEPEYTWYEGLFPEEFDDEARTWLAEILPRVYRTSGLDADGRVDQLMAEGGLEAVYDEMQEIDSDSVLGTYVREILTRLSEQDDLVSVLDLCRREVSSDYELGRTLRALDAEQLAGAKVREAWVRALGSIDSDWELRRTLSQVAESGELDAQVLEALLEAGRTVGSDHEQSQLLMTLARNLSPDVALPEGYFENLETIGSDHNHRQALSVALERPGLTQPEAGALLATARHISGDFELMELLVTFARDAPADWTLPASFFEAAGRIDSDSSMNRVLTAVVEHRGVKAETAVPLLDSAQSVSSDFELASFLARFVEALPASAEMPEEFDRLLESVGSDFERQKIEEALEERPSPPRVLEAVEEEFPESPEDSESSDDESVP